MHHATKHLQQKIESDHFRVKRATPSVGEFQLFHASRRTKQGCAAMLWLYKDFGPATRIVLWIGSPRAERENG